MISGGLHMMLQGEPPEKCATQVSIAMGVPPWKVYIMENPIQLDEFVFLVRLQPSMDWNPDHNVRLRNPGSRERLTPELVT